MLQFLRQRRALYPLWLSQFLFPSHSLLEQVGWGTWLPYQFLYIWHNAMNSLCLEHQLFLTKKFPPSGYTENRWRWRKCCRPRRTHFQGWRRSDPCSRWWGWTARPPGSGKWWRGRRAGSGRGRSPPGEVGSTLPSSTGWNWRHTCKMLETVLLC